MPARIYKQRHRLLRIAFAVALGIYRIHRNAVGNEWSVIYIYNPKAKVSKRTSTASPTFFQALSMHACACMQLGKACLAHQSLLGTATLITHTALAVGGLLIMASTKKVMLGASYNTVVSI